MSKHFILGKELWSHKNNELRKHRMILSKQYCHRINADKLIALYNEMIK